MKKLRTHLIHAGALRDRGSVASPLFRSATYRFEDPEDFDDIRYTRLNNTPSQCEVELKLAALHALPTVSHSNPKQPDTVAFPSDDTESLVTPSGTAAVWLALYANLSRGTHVLAPERIYGGTRKTLELLKEREGIEVSYVPIEEPEAWESAIGPSTRCFFFESMSNPWIEVPPLDSLRDFCRRHGLMSIVDNTLLTPALFRPLPFGFDLVVESASKSLGGHSDVVAGVVTGKRESMRVLRRLANRLGVCPDPEACRLLSRGLKTLQVRLEAQCGAAASVAKHLNNLETVSTVLHPSVPGSKTHERSCRFFEDHGSLLTIVITGGDERVAEALSRFEIAIEAPSFGGVETLVSRPALTSQGGLTDEVRRAIALPGGMLRISVGLEDPDDIVKDLTNAIVPG